MKFRHNLAKETFKGKKKNTERGVEDLIDPDQRGNQSSAEVETNILSLDKETITPEPVAEEPREMSRRDIFSFGNFLDFGWLTAPLYIAGLGYAFTNPRNPIVRRLLLYCVPYTILWWWRFSFDARLLLAVLPFYAILVGATGACAWRRIVAIMPHRTHQFLGIIVILSVTAAGIYQAKLGGLLQWATNPGASYTNIYIKKKLYIQAGGGIVYDSGFVISSGNEEFNFGKCY